ncbi:MAG: hypothetical protein AB7K68_12655 [Bacteriovoracia bacterium]
MKTYSLPVALLMVFATGLTVSACGKTTRNTASEPATGSAAIVAPPPTFTYTNTSTSTSTSTTGTAPLSFEFTKQGNQTVVTNSFNTDNVLKVKFRVTADQGNQVHQATELKVTIAFNGTEVTPTYTSNNYTFGMVGETSNVIDLSSYLTPGVPVQITVKNPKNDFYCTYAPNPFYYFDYNTGTYIATNPQYNVYPGCRKEVFTTHNWGGVLTIQTSSTQSI